MGMDLSKLSDADLQHIKNRDLGKLSDEGLSFLSEHREMLMPTESHFIQDAKPLDFQGQLRQELKENPVGASYAAAGTALSDPYQGGKQLLGFGDKQAIQNNETIRNESPIGAMAGDAALWGALGVMSPALNTTKGTTIGGGGVGLLQPTTNDNVVQGKVANAMMGSAAGYTGSRIAKGLGDNVATNRVAEALRQSQNATRDATWEASRKAGYVGPPTQMNPSWTNRTLESIAGKNAVKQGASIKNQEVTDALIRETHGLPQGTALSEKTLDDLRYTQAAPYREAASLPDGVVGQTSTKSQGTGRTVTQDIVKNGEQLISELKDARFKSKNYWKEFNRTGSNAARETAVGMDKQADNLESQLETLAIAHNKPDLVGQLKQSRKEMASTYNTEKAMNDATGTIDAAKLATMSNNGSMLTKEQQVVADFSNAFPTVDATPERQGSDGVSKIKMIASLLSGGVGTAAGGPVGGMAGAAIPFVAPDVAKSILLSKPYQAMMANPKYGVGPTKKLAEALLASRYSPMAITGGAIPALTQ